MNSSFTLSIRLFTSAGRVVFMALVFASVLASLAIDVSAQAAPQADIVVSKSAEETVALGGQITYSLTVYNAGPDDAVNIEDDAVNIVLTDALPAHTTFVDASTNTGSVSFDGTTLTINVGTLAF
ncbi:MAG TPA: hypothetical protein VN659_04210, partial [Pyrinomonadaceae bacterium]|nr:hypothetical protein [Pyrinomonadaceae bacterium]